MWPALGFPISTASSAGRSLSWWDQRDAPICRNACAKSASIRREPARAPGNGCAWRASILGFPRHLSQHVGGFVISRSRSTALVPVENAAMPERTVIQWDKDDIDALG
jgi:error-prone DNA polymerase